MPGEVDVCDVAGSHGLVDAGGHVVLGHADQHVGQEVQEVERQERLHEGVRTRFCQRSWILILSFEEKNLFCSDFCNCMYFRDVF